MARLEENLKGANKNPPQEEHLSCVVGSKAYCSRKESKWISEASLEKKMNLGGDFLDRLSLKDRVNQKVYRPSCSTENPCLLFSSSPFRILGSACFPGCPFSLDLFEYRKRSITLNWLLRNRLRFRSLCKWNDKWRNLTMNHTYAWPLWSKGYRPKKAYSKRFNSRRGKQILEIWES